MKAHFSIICPALALLIASGCDRLVAPHPAPITADDLQVARQALPISEVSLMLRSGYKEQAIVAEVARRRVPEKLDAKTEDSLLRSGAGPALIDALKTNVLTPNQKAAYDELAAERETRTAQEHSARQQEASTQRVAEENERQRKQMLAQQTLQIARATEERVQAYDKADQAYQTQKLALKNKIAFQEAYINQKRGRGWNESQLLEDNEKLNRLREDLRNLKEPLR